MNLIILRGLPGSGKSTIANLIFNLNPNKTVICCADDYFVKKYGYYNWNPKELYFAHQYSKDLCKTSMINGVENIIIANTNVKQKEYKTYIDMAKEFNYKVFSLIVENINNTTPIDSVNMKTIQRMKNNFDINL